MPLASSLLTSLLPQIIGQQQIGAAAPAFNMGVPKGPSELSPKITQMDLPGVSLSPPTSQQAVPDFFRQGSTPPMDTTNDEQTFGSRVEGFFGNLDQNLQSPSKVIGLGLLNQIDPRLAGAGLLAGGLFGGNRVF